MRVDPPTITTSLISFFSIPASSRTCFTGASVRLKRSEQSSSNLALVRVTERSFPSINASTSIVTSNLVDRARFPFSTSRRSLAMALWSGVALAAILFFFLNSFSAKSTTFWSKSSPPKWVSPLVATTSNTPLSIVNKDTSKVPPPRSYTKMFFSAFLSRPYAMAAAVGSLIIRSTFKPAMDPASLVEVRWASLKYAGTVITACFTSLPK
mmetsp:Transcript_44073/g.93784  ORF Transcript_44073/g.93784 Transcript_44073/m.93784 type:complete len:210 (+) Transcript_44073:268-897(+)